MLKAYPHHVERERNSKIMCPTESDEMNVKRIARYQKGVPNAQCSIEINRFPPFVNVYSDSDRARQHQTCKNTSGVGYEVTLVKHVDSQSAKAWASKQGFATDETCNVEVHVRARRTGEEANDTCLCKARHSDVRSGQNVS